MGYHHHGRALRIDFRENVHNFLSCRGVQRSGGLIGKNNFRIAHQCAADSGALKLPAGGLGNASLGKRQDTGAFHESLCLFFRLCAISSMRPQRRENNIVKEIQVFQ